jgi:endonuclease YncB( thermonuclease family)
LKPGFRAFTLLIIVTILLAGCDGQVPTVTVTPDAAETAAAEAAILDLTAEYDSLATTQAEQNEQAAALEATNDELATVQADLAAEQAALAEAETTLSTAQAEQADQSAALDASGDELATAQADLTADQAALDEAEAALSTAQAEQQEQAEVLEATGAELATAQADLAAEQTAIANAQATLTAAQMAQDAFAVAIEATQTSLDAAQADLLAAQQAVTTNQAHAYSTLSALATQQAQLATQRARLAEADALNTAIAATNSAVYDSLYATSEALNATATQLAQPTDTPDLTGTPIPMQAETAWRIVTLEPLAITLPVPDAIGDPTYPQPTTAYLEGTFVANASPANISVARLPAESIFSQTDLSQADQQDPVSVLQLALDEPGTMFEVAEPAAPLNVPGSITAARTRMVFPDFAQEMVFVLYRLADNDWVGLGIYGTAEEVAAWEPEILSGITFGILPGTEPTMVPTEEPVEGAIEPTAAPADDTETLTTAQDALNLDFAVPAGWIVELYDSPEGPSVILTSSDRANSIALTRGNTEFIESSVFTQPLDTGLENPTASELVQSSVDLVKEVDDTMTGGRVNELTVGELTGAWTQFTDETETLRIYIFDLSGDDWLLIAATGPQDTYNLFNRNELREFMGSLQPRADQGVALRLNFSIPEGWELIPIPAGDMDEGLTPEGIRLEPVDVANPETQIIITRGTAADYAGLNMPLEEGDPVIALEPIAAAILESGELGSRLRVEPLQLGTLDGAFATLRGEELTVRAYLFATGLPDDWVLMLASAPSADFNAFNRAALREVLGSLEPAAGGSILDRPLVPIGPIEEAIVEHVSDGDTIYVITAEGLVESVRIIGIDTPEAHHPDSGVAWLGYEATHFIEQYTPAGSTVYLESDISDRDDFDRLLRYVWIKDEDGNWINVEAELIRAGLARVRTYDEDRYVLYFTALQDLAQEERLGVWGDPPPPPPVDSIAERNDDVWAHNPDGGVVPLLYDAAALGNVPDPVAYWPQNISAVVRDVYYVYPTDIDPVTGVPVSEDKVGYWYWLEINDFRGWVPESWIMVKEPEWTDDPPDTDIIAYAMPFIVADEPVEVLSEAGSGDVLGTFEPETRVQVKRLGIDPMTGDWWLYVDTQTIDGWLPLANLNRLAPEYR